MNSTESGYEYKAVSAHVESGSSTWNETCVVVNVRRSDNVESEIWVMYGVPDSQAEEWGKAGKPDSWITTRAWAGDNGALGEAFLPIDPEAEQDIEDAIIASPGFKKLVRQTAYEYSHA